MFNPLQRGAQAATLQKLRMYHDQILMRSNNARNPTAGTRGGTRAKDGQHATPIDARWIESRGSSLEDGHLHAFHSFITLPTNLKGRNHLNFVRVRTIATPVTPAPRQLSMRMSLYGVGSNDWASTSVMSRGSSGISEYTNLFSVGV